MSYASSPPSSTKLRTRTANENQLVKIKQKGLKTHAAKRLKLLQKPKKRIAKRQSGVTHHQPNDAKDQSLSRNGKKRSRKRWTKCNLTCQHQVAPSAKLFITKPSKRLAKLSVILLRDRTLFYQEPFARSFSYSSPIS